MGNCYKKTLKKVNSLAKKINDISKKVDDAIPDDIKIDEENEDIIKASKIKSIKTENFKIK